jgi:preprotein translocase subunit SecG
VGALALFAQKTKPIIISKATIIKIVFFFICYLL